MKLANLMIAMTLTTGMMGCEGPVDRPQSLPTIVMQIGHKRFTLEVAATEEQRRIGLMFRDSMPADHGMLFVFDKSEVLDFWMKNTNIPLDIVYLSPDQKIVSIHQMEPHDQRGVSSDYPAQFAIELNQNAADDCGAKVGDQLAIPHLPSVKPDSKPATTQSR